ncbi:MAG: cation transporter [Lachnospiraceae bacterium]|nr:cation transporter [Lachnospiraceae bacterium]
MENSAKSRDQIIVQTSMVGIFANIFLAVFKAAIGVFTHSIAITLDAVNNFSDVLSSVITIIGTKLAHRAPDKDHPWGHGRAEYLSAMVIAVIVLYAGVTSLVESVRKLLHPEVPDYTTVTLVIVAVGVLVKILLGNYVKSIGEKVNSESLVDSGQDALMDSVISASTLVAALIFLNLHVSLEAPLGAIISLVIVKSGIDMLRQTTSELLGQRIDIETATEVKELLGSFPQVHGVYDLIFHDYGPGRLNCSAHVEVDDTLTADEIDRLQRSATYKLYEEKNIILTALSVYAINTKDSAVVQMRRQIQSLVMKEEHIIEMHGFYVDGQDVFFDVIVSFDAKDRTAVYQKMYKLVEEVYPEYRFHIALDTDFAVS